MRRHLAATALGAVVLLAGAACGSDSDGATDADRTQACNEYHRLVNQWSIDYGAEMGAVAQAAAAGDEGRRETAVTVVRELFQTTADGLRAQAGQTPDEELAGALTEAADGLVEIAEEIETYEDVEAAPSMMSDGRFAEGGQRVSDLCG